MRESHNSKRHMHPNVYCSTIYSSQDIETTKVSIKKRMDKEDVVATYDEILLGHKKGKIVPFFSSLDGPRDCQSDVSQTEKEKYRMISLTCRI